MNDRAKKVLSDAMALSQSEDLSEILHTSLPRPSMREQAEIERVWADEAASRAVAMKHGNLTAQDGATALADLRSELPDVRSK